MNSKEINVIVLLIYPLHAEVPFSDLILPLLNYS